MHIIFQHLGISLLERQQKEMDGEIFQQLTADVSIRTSDIIIEELLILASMSLIETSNNHLT